MNHQPAILLFHRRSQRSTAPAKAAADPRGVFLAGYSGKTVSQPEREGLDPLGPGWIQGHQKQEAQVVTQPGGSKLLQQLVGTFELPAKK